MHHNPLRSILALLVVAPQPLSPLEVAAVCNMTEDDARLHLRSLEAADMARESKDGKFEPLATKEVEVEVVSEVRFMRREREIRRLSTKLEDAVRVALA